MSLHPLPVIKSPPRGNAKLGDVLTDSRPTGKTCPETCPFKNGKCYSLKGEAYHPGPIPGWDQRDQARRDNPEGWQINRRRQWAKEAQAARPIRFLVHGDLMDPTDHEKLDRNYLASILVAARAVPNFKGWAYTHAWRYIRPRTVHHLLRAGITLWASCHSAEEALNAAAKGFPIAIVAKETVKGYKGPRTIPDSGAGRPAIVCPHQLGRATSCLDCGYCWNGNKGRKTDLVLLSH